ncbi:anthranilate synthase component I family protein [Synechococcus elongatus]|uniref:Anthranilate synthase component 1 n=1 Tax=Synechococcus sp. (strain ATCC 27144 / PCC 6301 / SAUG 1402/1) TaxID=269084 RepID=A0A0H3K6G4_SYNP6|nr:anthranilate synthase component I family protein [Synechococcus elongatus]AJD58446.1 anthranilate synthase [Synechococcus elongatus UTEX 2973]MBD2587435.1 anthranilate synthase component I family protein [Synechococcus elongatus FACHB-242]UOW73528.1 anthranilate synthase, component I [Synechococcus elongatus PCC 6311]UOW76248.1 anthranilate synthase, component I [Synechococcus elongatus PCC 6301]BAD78732.1 anthranilate synthetase alpha-subunit [Synechococcus elongatus PCC 6301]
MIYPDFATFASLAEQGNFIPVYQEWVADLDTPVSAWYRICRDRPYSFLLESVEGGEHLGRYSFLGCDPLWVLEARGDRTTRRFRDGSEEVFSGDPFAALKQCLAPYQPVHLPQLPSGVGGLFGFWGYELMRWIEPRVPVHSGGENDLPDGCWMQVDSLMIFDQVKRRLYAIAYADLQAEPDLHRAYALACNRVQELVNRFQGSLSASDRQLPWLPPQSAPSRPVDYQSNTTQEQFCANVLTAQDYIRAGDIFQVVLSQRLTTHYSGDPFDLYRSLRLINPSPYMAFFRFGDWQLIGSSPEVMVKAEQDPHQSDRQVATVRPIAGTRPRVRTAPEDAALATDLLADPKEVAEHVMLVDLGRNDLGRVCEKGSVRVDELMVIERYSHVMHIVSNVVGLLDRDRDAWDLLRATFPAGTVSGAPKIRAMEIIHELEGCRRGPYSGAYGYYDFEGQLNTAITIRTMIVQAEGSGHRVSVQAGAGVVADSVPIKEYEETLNKARGLLEAIRCLQPPQVPVAAG